MHVCLGLAGQKSLPLSDGSKTKLLDQENSRFSVPWADLDIDMGNWRRVVVRGNLSGVESRLRCKRGRHLRGAQDSVDAQVGQFNLRQIQIQVNDFSTDLKQQTSYLQREIEEGKSAVDGQVRAEHGAELVPSRPAILAREDVRQALKIVHQLTDVPSGE